MFRNSLAAALRHLARGRLYAAISVCGLAIGICAITLALLVARNQLGYNGFVRDADRAYLALTTNISSQQAPAYSSNVPHTLAAALRADFPGLVEAARIRTETVSLQHGVVKANELIHWADPSFFEVLPLPAVAGDLQQALHRADGIVLTRAAARKYFGRDAPLGETLLLNGETSLTVRGVIEDLPENATDLVTGIFVSALLSRSAIARLDRQPANAALAEVDCTTYLRLAPQASPAAVQARLLELSRVLMPVNAPGMERRMSMLRIDAVHVSPQLHPGAGARVLALGGIGALTLLIACINFINLATARAARRAREIAIRKVAGAGRGALLLQFLGETLVYVLLAACLGMALTELLLPRMNAFLQAGARFDYWQEPGLWAWFALGIAGITLLAGIYPAWLLARLAPAGVLKGGTMRAGGLRVRQVLVTLQFAVLIAMLATAGVVYQQRSYALGEALRVVTDQHVLVETECRQAVVDRVQAMPGVRHAGCINECFMRGNCMASLQRPDGTPVTYGRAYVDAGVMQSLGIEPIAGILPADATQSSGVVINEQARLRFGFSSATTAIGKLLPGDPASTPREIVAVVPDFSLASVDQAVGPMVYSTEPMYIDLLDVQLDGQQVPAVLAALDQLQPRYSPYDKLRRYFLDERLERQYLSILRMAQTFGLMSLVAVLLACLGLLGLAAATTERRTCEIGIRKALGADRSDIVLLLLWQSAQPVLWASALAWPLCAWLLTRWLNGYAYHVALSPSPFVGATALALLMALATVAAHSYAVAGVRPVLALRHEQ